MKQGRVLGQIVSALLALLAGAAAAHAQFTIVPSSLSFASQGGQTAEPYEQVLNVSSTVPGTATITANQPWVLLYDINRLPISATTPVSLPSVVYVSLQGSTLPRTPGNYSATVNFAAAGTVGSSAAIPVSLTVLGNGSGSFVVTPASLTFNYQFGGPFPLAQRLSINSTGSSLSFNLNTATTNGLPWLSVATNSYYTPATVTVSAIPLPGMGPGVYTGAVYVIPVGTAGVTQTIPVTLIIGSSGTLVPTPTYLTYNYQSGGAAPSPQTVTVVNAVGGNVAYNVGVTTSNGLNWLAASPINNTTPSSFFVAVYPAALSPATYYGTVSIYQAGSTVPASQIPVTLIVNNGSQLIASPSNLTFSYISGAAAPPSQFISVTSTGAPVAFSALVSGPSWVTLSAGTGTTPTALAVNVNPPAGAAPGNYSATVLITPTTTGGSSLSVGISVNVTPSNYISVSQSSVSFDFTSGGVSPGPQSVYVTSSSGPVHFDAVAATSGFGPWLQASQSSQNTPGYVTITANPSGLAVGTYSGTVSIVADSANNSPLSISVTLNVTKSATFTSNPFGISFSWQVGQADPPFQTAVISSAGTPLPFSLTTSTSSGGSWLLAGGGGTTPSTIIAGISPNLLTPGTYSGSLNIQPGDATLLPLRVPVLLNVASGPVFMPSTNQLTFQHQINASVPQAQSVTIGASGSAVLVYYPTAKTSDGGTWLQVTPSSAATPSPMAVTVNPAGLAAGTYYGVVISNDAAGVAPAAYVPVSLQVTSGPILTVAGQLLVFTAKAGGAPPAVQQITVGGGGNTLPYHVDASGGSWLQVTPTDGSTDAVVSVVASPASVTPGYYAGVITISIPGVANSQQYVPVVFVAQ